MTDALKLLALYATGSGGPLQGLHPVHLQPDIDRLRLPQAWAEHWRRTFGATVFIHRYAVPLPDIDPAPLLLYPPPAWEQFCNRVDALDDTYQAQRAALRRVTPCRMDKRDWIALPRRWREATELDTDAVLVGLGTVIEVWNTRAWRRQVNALFADKGVVSRNP